MADEATNLILEHLSAIRGDIGAVREDVRGLKGRMTAVETVVAALVTSNTTLQHSVDRLTDRVERIERGSIWWIRASPLRAETGSQPSHVMTLIPEPLRAELAAAYTAPGRHYHDLRHIEALNALAAACAEEIADRDAVEAAIWFHDAIYDTRRHDNEERSAALAEARLAGTADRECIARIAAMIRATAGHAMPDLADAAARHDCALFLDMDLSILGSPEADFDAYEEAVRREYDWVTGEQWRQGRRAVLTGFLARPAIYLTARFRTSHEAAARRNLARAIARLDAP